MKDQKKDFKGKFKPGFKKDFKPRPKQESFSKYIEDVTRHLKINEVNMDLKGDTLVVYGIIDRIVQTGGPTIFQVSDGTGTLALKGFEGAGVRAYPQINEGDAIKAEIKIEEFQGELEGEIDKMAKLEGTERENLLVNIEETVRKRATVTPVPFLVQDQILEKLKDRFIKAATEIRLAIIQNRPIIVRHHNDTDGYSSGFSLERAILPLISKQHTSAKSTWEYYTRAPCAAPMYEIDDSIRDTSHSLSAAAKFSNKIPLVIIADTGSGEQDLLGIQQGKVHGMDFIVIDHHFSERDVISEQVLVHINPFLVGEDGAKFSAGMLCAEFARFINPEVQNINQIPAMAGIADRINNPKVMDTYLKIAEKEGYSKKLLSEISLVIDFVSSKIRFMEAREYIEVVFGEPRDKQKKLVELMAPYITKLETKGLEIAKSAAKSEKIGKTTLQSLAIESTFPRGFYPKPGKCVGMIHDDLQEKKVTNLVSIGVLTDAITIRATDEANFSVHDYIAFINKKLPEAFVEGGGHKNAGSIKFLPSKQPQIIQLLHDFIKSR